jgi:hypothetical protein
MVSIGSLIQTETIVVMGTESPTGSCRTAYGIQK